MILFDNSDLMNKTYGNIIHSAIVHRYNSYRHIIRHMRRNIHE